VRVTAHETRTVHDIGKSIADWFQQVVVFGGIVFEVSVLDNEVFAGCFGDTGMQCGALAFVGLVFVILDVEPGIGNFIIVNGMFSMVV
jgi:hypothetical protein